MSQTLPTREQITNRTPTFGWFADADLWNWDSALRFLDTHPTEIIDHHKDKMRFFLKNSHKRPSSPTFSKETVKRMEEMFYKGESKMPNTLHGLYDKQSDTIILPDTWDRRKPWDLGVLLHEMVHYLQDMNDHKFGCTAEMERDAWPIQQRYLKERHDYTWDYDGLWYAVISTCNY